MTTSDYGYVFACYFNIIPRYNKSAREYVSHEYKESYGRCYGLCHKKIYLHSWNYTLLLPFEGIAWKHTNVTWCGVELK
jgi:hypothetical protein